MPTTLSKYRRAYVRRQADKDQFAEIAKLKKQLEDAREESKTLNAVLSDAGERYRELEKCRAELELSAQAQRRVFREAQQALADSAAKDKRIEELQNCNRDQFAAMLVLTNQACKLEAYHTQSMHLVHQITLLRVEP